MGQYRLGQLDNSEEVDLEAGAESSEVVGLDGADVCRPRIVEHRVQAPQIRDHGLDARDDGIRVGDVEGTDVDGDARRFGRRAQCGGLAGVTHGGHRPPPGLRGSQGSSQADARGRSGDENGALTGVVDGP